MRETPNTTSLLIEYGFIDNPRDVTKLQNNLLDYAEAVVKAVANYIGVPYVNPSGIEENVYTVQRGDSLYSIAQKFNTTVDTIKRLNNLTSNTLQIGQNLIVSESSISPGPSNYITYTVKSGDSLWKIANQYDTTTDAIKRLNNLSSNTLQIGQQLKIPTTSEIPTPQPEPSTPTGYITYTVKSGDSLWRIASQFNVTVSDITNLNNLGSNVLQVGQQLKIPTTADNTGNTTTPTDSIIYTVQNGDSLWKISQRYNVPVSDIISANNLTTTLLQVGQQLRIPSTSQSTPSYTEYTVQRGDSLWLIANRYNTTVNEIKNLNNLTSNTLQIGQVLRIPQ